MKKINTSLILILLVNLVQAQNPLLKQWDHRFGGNATDYIFSLQPTADAGFILGGQSQSQISGDKTEPQWGGWDYWIVKTDSDGVKQWDRDFGGNQYDYLYCVKQTADGGYILGGAAESDSSGNKTSHLWGGSDYWIIKTDAQGVKQWEKDFGGTSNDVLYSLQQTLDGGYILGGTSYSGISGNKTVANWDATLSTKDYWVIKTDSMGNVQWQKDFGGTDSDELKYLQQTADGGYILGGTSLSNISGDKTQDVWTQFGADYWILKINSLGIKQWDKDFGGNDYDYFSSLQQTSDHGYILAGYSSSGIGGDKTQACWGINDYWIVKTDSLGNKQWEKDFGGTGNDDELGTVLQTTDGGYLIPGTSDSPLSGDKSENNLGIEQGWVVKTNSSGTKLWDITMQSPGNNEECFLTQANDGCYAIAVSDNGSVGGFNTQASWNISHDYWIIKFCDTTATTSINQIANSQLQISIYPNPANTTLNISINNNENILITNLLGEIVLQKNFSSNTKGKVELDISFLSAGIYFIRAGNEVRKFVKE